MNLTLDTTFKEHDLISNWLIISEEEKKKRIELYILIF